MEKGTIHEPRLQGNMGTGALVMSVLAFVGPLGATTGILPVFISYAGSGAPAVYFIIMVILLLFAVGFAKMGTVMGRPGGFYAFVTDGLGKKLGFVSASLASVGYPLIGLWAPPLLAIQVNLIITEIFGGEAQPWVIWTIVSTLLSGFFAYHKIDLTAKVLVVVMIMETIFIVIFDIYCFKIGVPANGADAMFTGPVFSNGELGMAMLFVFGSFFGFEATVIYREESRKPDVTIPRATYASIILICVLFGVTTWAYTAFWGASNIENICDENAAGIFAVTTDTFFNKVVYDIIMFASVFSVFASQLSIHNVAARYWYSMGVDGVIPKMFGKVHPKHHSPYVAVIAITIFWIIMMIIFYVSGQPADTVYPLFSGCGTFFVTIIMFMTSIAVIAYFKKTQLDNINTWTKVIAPVLSAVGIGAVVILSIIYFPALLGSSGWVTGAFIGFIAALMVVSYFYARRLERSNPEAYERLGRNNPGAGS